VIALGAAVVRSAQALACAAQALVALVFASLAVRSWHRASSATPRDRTPWLRDRGAVQDDSSRGNRGIRAPALRGLARGLTSWLGAGSLARLWEPSDMTAWKKVRNLFWQGGEEGPAGAGAGGVDAEMSDEDFAAMLSGSPHAVPPGGAEPVDAASVQMHADPSGALAIDFQQQYDLAGIPNTDEVEQLENFIARLDPALPQTSRIAAAQAFLGAVGKDKAAVFADAERKILRVRGIAQAKDEETRAAIAHEQAQIAELQAQIESHRQRIEAATGQLEGVRQACIVEESRLQAARVFFGNVDPVGVPKAH
jgi:hypothetical protein